MTAAANAGYFLSPQQQSIWMSQPGGAAQISVLLRGAVDPARLKSALAEVMARHEILRTVFPRQPGMKFPFQVIAAEIAPAWDVPDQEDWDFERGPLLRATLATVAEGEHVLTLTLSSLCADAQSLINLVSEMMNTCAGQQPESGPLRYVQFAQWQSEMLESLSDAGDEHAQEGNAFWAVRAAISGAKLPFAAPTDAGARRVTITLPDARQLESDFLLTAWQCLLARISGNAEFVTGVVSDGREYEELSGALGPIAKTLPILASFSGNLRFSEALRETRKQLEAAAGWQEYFDPARPDLAPNITFQHIILPGEQQAGAVKYRVLRLRTCLGGSHLQINALQNGPSLSLELEYDTSKYAHSQMEQMARHLQMLVEGAVKNPESLASRLPLLAPAERERIEVAWNRTERVYLQASMRELIEAQVARAPERTAVRCGEVALTYAELDRRATQLGNHLRRLGVGPNVLVALCLERSVEMLVAVLGIWKAGGAYVPLSADNPKARLQQQLAGVKVLLTESGLDVLMPEFAGPIVLIDQDGPKCANGPEEDFPALRTIEDLAYVIYTSGSTGAPKGVGVRQRNLVNYASYIAEDLLTLQQYPEGLQFATVSTLGADLGNTCIFPALISGGCVHVIPYEVATDGLEMARYQERYQIDVLKIVPSHLAALLAGPEGGKTLPRKYLLLGGEALTRSLLQKIAAAGAACQVINHYGPTETTVGSLVQPLREYDWANNAGVNVPIGKPIANTQAYVLDGELQVVPEGVAGELYISGAGVAAGYVGQPEMTAERFLPNPFLPQTLMYRTGDLARYQPAGEGRIEFLGRADDQVKVRGFRVELGEIEAALTKQSGVRQAVVVAQSPEQEDEQNGKRLVGYVALDLRSAVTAAQLKQALELELPGHMVPSVLVLLEKLPLNANGKVDRKALPRPEAAAAQAKVYSPPQTATEEQVAQIWREILKLKQVGRDDDFFQLGGHSLLATQVVSRIREHNQVEIALRTLFESSVLSDFAAKIDLARQSGKTAAGAIQRVSRDAYRAARTGN